ncbi:hypothetical protein [Roseomonas sp. AR75]|uniref:hypothetical protein n=1 Tax=Roseomonas sp. AR75 TaxID=2562311 RepID=UPI0010C083BB|nr:hypothetical protein [Roseomonas sp. AR75]
MMVVHPPVSEVHIYNILNEEGVDIESEGGITRAKEILDSLDTDRILAVGRDANENTKGLIAFVFMPDLPIGASMRAEIVRQLSESGHLPSAPRP